MKSTDKFLSELKCIIFFMIRIIVLANSGELFQPVPRKEQLEEKGGQ